MDGVATIRETRIDGNYIEELKSISESDEHSMI